MNKLKTTHPNWRDVLAYVQTTYAQLVSQVRTLVLGGALVLVGLLFSGRLQLNLQLGNTPSKITSSKAIPISLEEAEAALTPIQPYVKKKKQSEASIVAPAVADPQVSNTYNNLTYLLSPEALCKRNPAQASVCESNCRKYVARFSAIAQAEQAKFGIPSSIILAQGLLESNAGQSRLTKACNNHFGIKCFSKHCKKGHCRNFTDDTHKDFFKHYPTAWDSYRAHSQFLQQARYARLFKLSNNDYAAWAKGLKACGYATDPNYAEKITRIIDFLQLYRFD